jgi:hypothetical protein
LCCLVVAEVVRVAEKSSDWAFTCLHGDLKRRMGNLDVWRKSVKTL